MKFKERIFFIVFRKQNTTNFYWITDSEYTHLRGTQKYMFFLNIFGDIKKTEFKKKNAKIKNKVVFSQV